MESDSAFTQARILIGVTGASGSIYANRLTEVLLPVVSRIYLVFTDTAKQVVAHEMTVAQSQSLLRRAVVGDLSSDERKIIRVFEQSDLFAPIASGSSAPTAMVVVPCSMGSLARMAQGVSSNLLERSCDVVLKQRRKLIICPREMPLNLIHLRNMTTLVEAGAEMLPLMPAFYQKPTSIDDLVDFCVGRILEQLGIAHSLYRAWNTPMR